MSNQSLINTVIELFDGVLLDEYGWEHYKIKDKKYDIRFDPSRIEWACDCPAFTYRRKFRRTYCKHILEIQERNYKRKRDEIARLS